MNKSTNSGSSFKKRNGPLFSWKRAGEKNLGVEFFRLDILKTSQVNLNLLSITLDFPMKAFKPFQATLETFFLAIFLSASNWLWIYLTVTEKNEVIDKTSGWRIRKREKKGKKAFLLRSFGNELETTIWKFTDNFLNAPFTLLSSLFRSGKKNRRFLEICDDGDISLRILLCLA